jgi:ArsR family transcriptional regulator, arsenate/arsenite/antimonite-responsive transcriptional repressor
MSITAPPTPETVANSADTCLPGPSCALIPREEAERMAAALKAIADPTRLQILRLIQSSSTGEACVCDLTECLGLRQPTISHHLKTMTAAGLLTRERRGTWVYYAVDTGGLEAVQNILSLPAEV